MSWVETLEMHRAAWKKKPLLRILYQNWYEQVALHLCPGRTVELGGGSGNLKEFLPDAISTDAFFLPWIDAVVDARHLPFGSETVTNLVLFDVLHHIEWPALFFDEALRVLEPGGRLVVMDPYISWLSWPIYNFLHSEPVDLNADPLIEKPKEANGNALFANQAVATILFERSMPSFQRRYPNLKLLGCRHLAFFVYPLSGGFAHPSLLPLSIGKGLLSLEDKLSCVAKKLAFRILIAFEKTP